MVVSWWFMGGVWTPTNLRMVDDLEQLKGVREMAKI